MKLAYILPANLFLLTSMISGVTAQVLPKAKLTEQMRIDGDLASLGDIQHIFVTPGGELTIAEKGTGSLRWFDTRGKASGVFGRFGAGPGEFRQTERVGMISDTIWVIDPGLRRITFVGPRHTLLRSMPLRDTITGTGKDPARDARLYGLVAHAILSDGSRLGRPTVDEKGPAAKWEPAKDDKRWSLIRYSAAGEYLGLTARIPDNECWKSWKTSGGEAAVSIPFCIPPVSDLAIDGSRVAYSSPSTIGMYGVTVVTPRGDTVFSKQYPYTPVAISKVAGDSARNSRLRGTKDPLQLGAYREMVLEKNYPPVRRLLLGRDGSVWIEHDGPAQSHQWTVIDKAGISLGTMTLPGNTTLRVAERGTIWTLVEDADGIESVVRYGIVF